MHRHLYPQVHILVYTMVQGIPSRGTEIDHAYE